MIYLCLKGDKFIIIFYIDPLLTLQDLADLLLHRMIAELIMRQRKNDSGVDKIRERVKEYSQKKLASKIEEKHLQV